MNPKHNHWYWFILLLAAEMVLVYPAHVLIDHTGLFHHHENGHDHTDDGFQDEEICVFCMNLGSMEDSKSVLLNSANQQEVYYSFDKGAGKAGLEQGNSARAPPTFFLM